MLPLSEINCLSSSLFLAFPSMFISQFLNLQANPYEKAQTPKARTWRKRSQGLECTRKGSKEGVTSVRFLVAIGYDKGVVAVEPVPSGMDGTHWASMINSKIYNKHLNKQRTIVQDNDPVQNCKLGIKAFCRQKIKLQSIPPKSPDINVIENLFNTAKRILGKQALDQQLTKESRYQLSERIKDLLMSYSIKRINNLIDSLPKRMNLLIEKKGLRLKY